MIRQLLRCALALWLWSPISALALEVSEIQVRSALNQLFDATILLPTLTPDDIGKVSVKIASSAMFEEFGLDQTATLNNLVFSLQYDEESRVYVKVISTQPIREPSLALLLEFNWPRGKTFREFTVLLDPVKRLAQSPGGRTKTVLSKSDAPVVKPTTVAATTETREASSFPVEAPSTPPIDLPDQVYGPVAPGEGLWGIALKLRPNGITREQMMQALFKTNPEAFSSTGIDGLKVGATLRIPSYREIADLTGSPIALRLAAMEQSATTVRPTEDTVPQPDSAPEAPAKSTGSNLEVFPLTPAPAFEPVALAEPPTSTLSKPEPEVVETPQPKPEAAKTPEPEPEMTKALPAELESKLATAKTSEPESEAAKVPDLEATATPDLGSGLDELKVPEWVTVSPIFPLAPDFFYTENQEGIQFEPALNLLQPVPITILSKLEKPEAIQAAAPKLESKVLQAPESELKPETLSASAPVAMAASSQPDSLFLQPISVTPLLSSVAAEITTTATNTLMTIAFELENSAASTVDPVTSTPNAVTTEISRRNESVAPEFTNLSLSKPLTEALLSEFPATDSVKKPSLAEPLVADSTEQTLGELPVAEPVEPALPTSKEPREYGPIVAKERLWDVVTKLRPDPSVGRDIMMKALFLANPQAFSNSSMDFLKEGAILRIPTLQEIVEYTGSRAARQLLEQQQAADALIIEPAEENDGGSESSSKVVP